MRGKPNMEQTMGKVQTIRLLSPTEEKVAARWLSGMTSQELLERRCQFRGRVYAVDGSYHGASTKELEARLRDLAEANRHNTPTARALGAEIARRRLAHVSAPMGGPDSAA